MQLDDVQLLPSLQSISFMQAPPVKQPSIGIPLHVPLLHESPEVQGLPSLQVSPPAELKV